MSESPNWVTAVTAALRAPSIHNTQPWRWRIRTHSVELHADWTRHLPWTDPDRRDLVVSCGAALHHLQVALAAQGFAAEVHRLPNPENEGHLATVIARPGPADPAELSLFTAIPRRRTDRRQMSHRAVPTTIIQACAAQAKRHGAALLPVVDPVRRARLLTTLGKAAYLQECAPGYLAELELWTHRYAGGRDGISVASVAPRPAGLVGSTPLRHYPQGRLRQPRQPATEGATDDAAELAVIATVGDDLEARLRAGEATSAVLLTATRNGLATTPLSQALEVASIRRELRESVLCTPEYPQLILRIGWPSLGADELPPTPRRELASVLLRR